MGTIMSSIVYPTVCSGTDQRRHQNPASLAFVRGIHRWPVDSPHKRPVMPKMSPFDDVIMAWSHRSLFVSSIQTGYCVVSHNLLTHARELLNEATFSSKHERDIYIHISCVDNKWYILCTNKASSDTILVRFVVKFLNTTCFRYYKTCWRPFTGSVV